MCWFQLKNAELTSVLQKGKWEERIKMEDEDDLEDLIEEKGAVPSGMCYVEFPG